MRKFPFAPIIFLAFFGWPLLQALISVYPTILWFDNLGYTSVFWTNLSAQALTGLVFGSLFFVIAAINIFIARRVTKDLVVEKRESSPAINIQKMIRELFGEQGGGASDSGMVNVTPQPVSAKNLNLLWGIGTLVISIFVGLSAVTQWQVVLKALNATAFGIVDPIFGRDIGFYVFSLPLHKFGQGFLFSAFLLPLFAVIWIYLTSNAISFSGLKLNCSQGVKTHLALLLAALAVIFAWGMWLGQLEILYSARGVVFGAGYTDVKAQLLAYNLQILLLIILAGLFLINIFQKDYRLPLTGLGAYLVVALFMGGIYPAIVQNLQVKPSEISLEAPYIKHGIKYTRMAYGLDEVEEKAFAADENLSLRDVQRNVLTIGNIRLWDPRPLIKTYRQLQGIRLYYDFSDDKPDWQIVGKISKIIKEYAQINIIFCKFQSILAQDVLNQNIAREVLNVKPPEKKKYLIKPEPVSVLTFLEKQIITSNLLQRLFENGLAKGAIRVRILEIGEIAEKLTESMEKFEIYKKKVVRNINNRKQAGLYGASSVWQSESIFTVYR